MKKKSVKVFLIIIAVLFIGGFAIYKVFFNIPSYALIGEVGEKDNIIYIEIIAGEINLKYSDYALDEIEDGIYHFQLYTNHSLFGDFGEHFPVTISIDNQNGHIKEIRQDKLDDGTHGPDEYDIVYQKANQ